MKTNGSNMAHELTLSMRPKELEECLMNIASYADDGDTCCHIKCGKGMICKETIKVLTEEYGYELIITIHNKCDTSVKCYFGDSADGSITIEQRYKSIKVNIDDLYKDIEKYFYGYKEDPSAKSFNMMMVCLFIRLTVVIYDCKRRIILCGTLYI